MIRSNATTEVPTFASGSQVRGFNEMKRTFPTYKCQISLSLLSICTFKQNGNVTVCKREPRQGDPLYAHLFPYVKRAEWLRVNYTEILKKAVIYSVTFPLNL